MPMSLQRWVPVCVCLLLAACSGGSAPPAQTAAPAAAPNAAQADKDAALYEQMRSSGSWEVALSLGNEVLKKYPGTPAAAHVQESIGDVQAKLDAQTSARRLSRLWAYASTPEAGGTQHTAAIASKDALTTSHLSSAPRIRLVLRQHPKWGQSVYLLLNNATFDCHGGCATLPVSFDGAPAQKMKATIPPTGEPALFIDDDKGFIAKLEKAKAVAIGVKVKDVGEKNVEFEVGGYDPEKMPDRPKK
jgi:hypothetical protein